jgi:photosystem II stability/assembly factor-like uncharacterized protein
MIRTTAKITLAIALAVLSATPARALPAWERIGPEGGSICALAAAPSRPATIYAGGADGGGIFRSVDRGLTWTFAGGDLGARSACSIAVDARVPARAWTVATGDLLRTSDGGQHWLQMDRPVDALPLAVIADPRVSERLYLATDRGLLHSADGGVTWTEDDGLPKQWVLDLVIDPARPQHLFIATYGGAFRSLDGGRAWAAIGPDLATAYATVLALDPRDGKTLYAALSNGSVYRSGDGGDHWTAGAKGLGVRSLAVAGRSLYAGTFDGLRQSRNGGKSFAEAATRLRGQQVADLAALPFGVLAATDLGAFRSQDGGASWTSSQRGLRLRAWAALTIDPQHPERWTSLDTHENLLRSATGGATWRSAATDLLASADVFRSPPFLALDAASSRLYSSYANFDAGGVLLRSDEDGRTWRELAGFGCLLPYGALTDAMRGRLFVWGGFLIGACGLQPGACAEYRSLDDGDTFQCAKDLVPQVGAVLTVHPPTGDLLASNADGLLRSTDWGEHWTAVSARRPIGLVIAAADPDLFYGFFSVDPGHLELAHSDDQGVSWSPPLPPPPGSLYPDPFDAHRLYALSPQALYVSTNHGATWQLAGALDPEVHFNALAFDPAHRDLVFAAATGGGLMRLRLED